MVNVARGATSSHINPRRPAQNSLWLRMSFGAPYSMSFEEWFLDRNQLTSARKRLPGRASSCSRCWRCHRLRVVDGVRVSGYAVVRDQPDHEAAGRISNWTKAYLHKAAVACRVSCMSRRARDDSLLNLVGASSRSPYQGHHEDDLCLRGGLGSRR